MKVNLARTLARSEANGPGTRFVVWVQGCPLACPGCWNPDTWPFERRQLRLVSDLAAEILGTAGIEGVTFTGGEPFAQAGPLAELAEVLRHHGLSVFIFTGYRVAELDSPSQQKLLALADGLVAGRYVSDLRTTDARWRGSTNQTMYGIANSQQAGGPGPSSEIVIAADGALAMTGFPADVLVAAFAD